MCCVCVFMCVGYVLMCYVCVAGVDSDVCCSVCVDVFGGVYMLHVGVCGVCE